MGDKVTNENKNAAPVSERRFLLCARTDRSACRLTSARRGTSQGRCLITRAMASAVVIKPCRDDLRGRVVKNEQAHPEEVIPVIVDPADDTSPGSPNTQNRGCRNAAIGCGVAAVLMAIVGIVITVIIVLNWRTFVSNFTVDLAMQVVDQSEIPQDGKERIRKRLTALAEDFQAGRLSKEQIGAIIEKVVESPLIVIALVKSAETQYVKPSGLDADEKAAAHRTLERFGRGLFEQKIAPQQQDEVMQHVMRDEGEDRKKIKQKMTDDEVRAFLAKAKEAADDAQVPDEPFDIDIADEFEKAIDAVLIQP